MRTFEEACEMVFCRKVTPETDDATATAVLVEAQERFRSVTSEAVNSPYADGLVETLYRLYMESDFSVETIIKNAFAQGVAVGIEMERAE